MSNRREELRECLAQCYRDFDNHAGNFEGLDYWSPRSFPNAEWAGRTGHPESLLAEAITYQRQFRQHLVGRNRDLDLVYADFEAAAVEWARETNNRRRGSISEPKVRNLPALRTHLHSLLEKMPLRDVSSRHDRDGDMSSFGRMTDRFGHQMRLSLRIRPRYGGKLYGYLKFPYYGDDEPREIAHGWLFGDLIFYEFGMNTPQEGKWYCEADGPPYTRVDQFAAVFAAFLEYLR